MNKKILLLALATGLFLLPAAAQRRPLRPCPQRAHVNELREQTRLKMNASRVRTKAGSATPRYGLIILAAFDRQPFTKDRAYFENLINGSQKTSALSYFNEQWNGFYDFHFDITDIVTVSQKYSYYGAETDDGDAHPEEMIIEACQLVDAQVDFSKYDNDGDGEVDNVFVFYAGDCGEGYDDHVWPHQWYVRDGAEKTLRLDGKLINNYACTSEIEYGIFATIGTFCHEYTHTFGIPDLYDSDSDQTTHGYAEAIWAQIDLMDAGNQNDNGRTPPYYSCLERWFFEMSDGYALAEGEYKLEPVHKNGDYFIVPTDREGEVYLIECRSNESWDKYIGGSGLVIYHVDASASAQRQYWAQNELNAYAAHQCMDLIECDPNAATYWRNNYNARDFWSQVDTYVPKVFWPDGGQTAFHAGSNPAWTYWSGGKSSLALTNIRKNADGSVSFTVTGEADAAPSVAIQDRLVLQNAAIIRWKAEGFDGQCVLRYKESDASSWTLKTVEAYQNGRFCCVLEGLKALTSYDVEIWAGAEGIPGPVNKTAGFTTKRAARGGEYPYIYLKDVPRNDDGSFPSGGVAVPLLLYNAPEGGVTWYFDGKEIQRQADGYYHITSSGELRAVSGDLTIQKHIYVK